MQSIKAKVICTERRGEYLVASLLILQDGKKLVGQVPCEKGFAPADDQEVDVQFVVYEQSGRLSARLVCAKGAR